MVVVGAARSGIAAAELLQRRGARVVLTERRDDFEQAAALRNAGIDVETGGHMQATFDAADLVVTSPGVPPDEPTLVAARMRGVEVIGELELASRWLRGRVIAVTGTKGKSTTTTLLGRMVAADGRRVLVGGNIGVPLSSQVDDSTPETIHAVEVSSFQLETTTTFRPWIALWINLADDHLDRHPAVASYAAAKARIFANQRAEDWAIVNLDDPVVMAHSEGIASTRVGFSPFGSTSDGFSVDGEWIVRRTRTATERLVPVSAVELTGRHMLGNVVAAVATASVAGISTNAIIAALREFRGLEHVMEPAGRIGDVSFVNDSKATNVEAARRLIESFPGRVVALVGGHFKGGDFRDLRDALASRGRAVVAMGEAAPLVREALADVLPVIDAASMREAVERGYEAARPDGVVLACAGMRELRLVSRLRRAGRVFKEEVERFCMIVITRLRRRSTEEPIPSVMCLRSEKRKA